MVVMKAYGAESELEMAHFLWTLDIFTCELSILGKMYHCQTFLYI
jgi:hypothetical protein